MKTQHSLLIATVAFFATTAATQALAQAQVSVQVANVVDGDTIWVRVDDISALSHPVQVKNGRAKVRMAGIDAPESCQPHGKESTAALRQILPQGAQIILLDRGADKYGRWLADPVINGLDVGKKMVQDGHAWNWSSARDPGRYSKEQQAAQAAKIGLWQHPAPMQPGLWRKNMGPCN